MLSAPSSPWNPTLDWRAAPRMSSAAATRKSATASSARTTTRTATATTTEKLKIVVKSQVNISKILSFDEIFFQKPGIHRIFMRFRMKINIIWTKTQWWKKRLTHWGKSPFFAQLIYLIFAQKIKILTSKSERIPEKFRKKLRKIREKS